MRIFFNKYLLVFNLLVIYVLALFILAPYLRHSTRILSFDNLDLNTVSEPLKSKVLNIKQNKSWIVDRQWMLLKISKGKTEYYTNDYNSLFLQSIINTLYKFEFLNSYIIPTGEYIIDFVDEVKDEPYWPLMSFSSVSDLVDNEHVILMPDFEAANGYKPLFGHIDYVIDNFPWSSKVAKMFFRGSATGSNPEITNIYDVPRIKFLELTKNMSFVDAGLSSYTEWQWNPEVLKEVKKKFPLKNFIKPDASLHYKYMLDINGNSCSLSRMAWILYSNSLLMKQQSNKVQWYYHKLLPYVHYLPIAEDFSNIEQQYAWAESHQAEVVAMTRNANQFATQVFSEAAVDLATIDAFKRYKRLISKRRTK